MSVGICAETLFLGVADCLTAPFDVRDAFVAGEDSAAIGCDEREPDAARRDHDASEHRERTGHPPPGAQREQREAEQAAITAPMTDGREADVAIAEHGARDSSKSTSHRRRVRPVASSARMPGRASTPMPPPKPLSEPSAGGRTCATPSTA